MGAAVEIKEFLDPSHVMIDVRAADKGGLLRELAANSAAALRLSPAAVTDALLQREKLGSTGTGGGIAIPHTRLPGIDKPFGMLVRLAQPIDFDAIDGQPVDVVFLLLLPDQPQGQQLNALACVARTLRIAEAVRKLRQAADGAAVYRLVAGD